MNYLIWKGKDSRDIKGLVICELPPISKPQMRISETVINGVDGSVIEELGYESYNKSVAVGITQNANIDEIIKYFSGTGEVIFSNEPDKYYKATIVAQVDYERLVRFKIATITFRVQPFKYDYKEKTASSIKEITGKTVEIDNAKVMRISMQGESVQHSTPTPDYRSMIQSIGTWLPHIDKYNIELNFEKESGTEEIVLELPHPLRSVPNGTRDKLLLEKDTLIVEKFVGSITLNGSEKWGMTNADDASALFYMDMSVPPKARGSCMSDHFVRTDNYTANSPIGIQMAGNQRLFIRAPFLSIAEFKTWLSENNTEILYELEYPEVMHTVDKTGLYTMPEGSMMITNDEDAEMTVGYLTDKLIANNIGNCTAKPVITITGSGYIVFILNDNKVFSYTFPSGENTVVIDCEKQDAYLGSVLKNRHMSGEFPVLEIGENVITWEGNVESIEITSKSRWL